LSIHHYLYTTVKLCDELFDGVATEDTLTVAVHQCCCGRLTNCRLLVAELVVIAAAWAIFALVLWSTKVVSIVIPFDEGMIEVRVAVTANPLVNETLLLEALIHNIYIKNILWGKLKDYLNNLIIILENTI